jgi:low temperature requirement protein LtrA
VGEPLRWETATALVGGAALYLLGHVAFKLRSLGSLSVQRLVAALVLLALVPLAHEVDALVTVAVVGVVLWSLIAFEALHYADVRELVRHAEPPS